MENIPRKIVIAPRTSRIVFTSRKAERTYRKEQRKLNKPLPQRKINKTTVTVDLHYKTTDEAIHKVQETLRDLDSKCNKVNFIVGRGNHSERGEPVLRPLIAGLFGPDGIEGYEAEIMSANCGIVSVIRTDCGMRQSIPIEV